MAVDVRGNLNKALLKKNPNRMAVSLWLTDHPDSSERFYEYIDTFFKIRFDSTPQMGVGTLLAALKSDDELGFNSIGVDGLRRWLHRMYPDA